MAKGMASSYAPISAAAVRSEIFEEFLHDPGEKYDYFRDISTYGGCTGGFAAALENMRIVEEEDLVENARAVGAYLLDRLQELADHPNVGDVRGKGLFAGIEFVADKSSKVPLGEDVMGAVMRTVTEEGVLIGRTNRSIPGHNNTLNIAPPLIVTKADIDEIVAAVRVGIEKGC